MTDLLPKDVSWLKSYWGSKKWLFEKRKEPLKIAQPVAITHFRENQHGKRMYMYTYEYRYVYVYVFK